MTPGEVAQALIELPVAYKWWYGLLLVSLLGVRVNPANMAIFVFALVGGLAVKTIF